MVSIIYDKNNMFLSYIFDEHDFTNYWSEYGKSNHSMLPILLINVQGKHHTTR